VHRCSASSDSENECLDKFAKIALQAKQEAGTVVEVVVLALNPETIQ